MAIIRGESIEDYHASSALSKTKILDFINDGPVAYKAKWIDRTEPHKETKALRFGRLFDGLTDNADRELARWAPPTPPNAPKRPPEKHRTAAKPSQSTLDAFAWWDEWDAIHAGKEQVSNEERFVLQQMLTEFRANPLIARVWERCERQVTIRRHIPELDIWVQSRPDGLCLDADPLLADVKTCRDMRRFDKDCKSFGYFVQLSIGQWLLAQEGFRVTESTSFLAVENHRYPRAKFCVVSEEDLLRGWEVAKGAVTEIARRTRENDWRHPVQTKPYLIKHFDYDDGMGFEVEE